MTEQNATGAPPPAPEKKGQWRDWWLFKSTPRRAAALNATVMWVGENAVGAIPLFAYLLPHSYRVPQRAAYLCPIAVAPTSAISACATIPSSIVQELCILTVVIAGLAVLPFVHLGTRARRAPPTRLSNLLVVLCVICLVGGAILYALASTYQLSGATTVTNAIMGAAAISSYFLSLEEAILDA